MFQNANNVTNVGRESFVTHNSKHDVLTYT